MKSIRNQKKKLSTLLHVERPRRLRPQLKKKNQRTFRAFSSGFNKKISKFTTPRFFLACLSITFMGIVMGIVFVSGFFHISSISVVRDSAYVNPQQIEQYVAKIKGQNILFVNTDELRQDLLDTFPMLSSVEIRRLFPQALQLKVSSYPVFARIKNEGLKTEFYLNSNGVIVQPDPNQKQTDQSTMLLITIPIYAKVYDEFKEILTPFIELKIGKKIFTKDQMQFLQKVVDTYQKNFDGKLAGLSFLPIEKEMHLKIASGTTVYFAVEKDLDTQLYMLKSFLTDLKADVLTGGEYSYIDLRIKDKVITCKKGASCARPN
ncbi:MAG: cell division protein FtsQ/DivIB [Candidatus Gracilibacteria bacterium]